MNEVQTVQNVTGLVTVIAGAVTSLTGLIASIIAAVKAGRADSTSKKTNASVEEMKATLTQIQNQRQVQQMTVNVGTSAGDAKGGNVMDLSRGQPPEAQG